MIHFLLFCSTLYNHEILEHNIKLRRSGMQNITAIHQSRRIKDENSYTCRSPSQMNRPKSELKNKKQMTKGNQFTEKIKNLIKLFCIIKYYVFEHITEEKFIVEMRIMCNTIGPVNMSTSTVSIILLVDSKYPKLSPIQYAGLRYWCENTDNVLMKFAGTISI